MTASRARLVQLLTRAVEATGHVLEDVTVSPAGKRRVVRVAIERAEARAEARADERAEAQGPAGGVTLDDVAEVARVVSDLLDEAERDEPDLLGGAYVLEVSSPGVDRPLTAPRHWRRNVGRLVTAMLADGSAVTGRVRGCDDVEVSLDVEGRPRILLLAEVTSGSVEVEFNRTAEGGDA